MIRDDYLTRMIQKAGAAMARALRQADQEDEAQTEAAIEDALSEIVRLPVATLLLFDQASLAPLLGSGDDRAARIFARGLRGLADVDERRGRLGEAKRKRACAISVYTRVGVGTDPADREAARAVTAKVMT